MKDPYDTDTLDMFPAEMTEAQTTWLRQHASVSLADCIEEYLETMNKDNQ